MKKLSLIIAGLLITAAAAFADRVVSPDSLPQAAKDLVSTHFPGKTVQFVEADFNEFEVVLNDGSQLQLAGNGDWKEVESYTGVPESMLPAAVVQHVKTTYPDILIMKAEKNWNNIEIKLSNRMELYFDTNGNLLGQKFDD